MSDQDLNPETGLATETVKPELEQPRMYRVVLLNDDYTPMEFVVYILQELFRLSREKSTQIMLEVHNKGKGVCGVYTRDIAETKVHQVIEFARQNEHPLKCEMEAE